MRLQPAGEGAICPPITPDWSPTACGMEAKKNRTLAGPVVVLSARGPTITFQRGTAASLTIAIWEDGQPVADSEKQYAVRFSLDNTMGRMSAMRGSHAAECARFRVRVHHFATALWCPAEAREAELG